jgi:hypothetical protein
VAQGSTVPILTRLLLRYVLLNAPNKHSSIACLKGYVKQIPGGAYPEPAKHRIAKYGMNTKYGMNMCGAGPDRARHTSRQSRAS